LPTPAVFIDRDGTLIVEREYLSNPALVKLGQNAVPALRRLLTLQVPLIVLTNQSGIGRGFFSLEEAEAVNRRVADLYAAEGIHFTCWYMCPHRSEEDCECRKPKAGMARAAAATFDLDLGRSAMIGDNRSDVELAANFGGLGVLVETGHGYRHRSWAIECGHPVCVDLLQAADQVLRWVGQPTGDIRAAGAGH